MSSLDRRGSDGDLDAIAPEGTDNVETDALATRLRYPGNDASGSLPRWVLVVAGVAALALVVSTVAAFHFQRKTRTLSRQLIRVDGLDPETEFDLETQSCDGAVGVSLDKGGAHRDASSFFETARLVVPRKGRSYNVVVRRYRGDPVVGFTLRWDKRVVALPVGTRGC